MVDPVYNVPSLHFIIYTYHIFTSTCPSTRSLRSLAQGHGEPFDKLTMLRTVLSAVEAQGKTSPSFNNREVFPRRTMAALSCITYNYIS